MKVLVYLIPGKAKKNTCRFGQVSVWQQYFLLIVLR